MFCKEKTKGYKDDLAPTTHPIEALCDSSDQAQELLDGITYGKGACFVRQLIMRIGIHAFLSGLRAYFAEHRWRNTTLVDFIRSMQAAHDPSSDSLIEFSNLWLKRKGVNCFTVSEQGSQEVLVLSQSCMDYAEPVVKEQIVNVLAILSDDFS